MTGMPDFGLMVYETTICEEDATMLITATDRSTDMFLATVDRAVTWLGPINKLIDRVVDQFIPTATVRACHGSQTSCGTRCNTRGCGQWCDLDCYYVRSTPCTFQEDGGYERDCWNVTYLEVLKKDYLGRCNTVICQQCGRESCRQTYAFSSCCDWLN